MRKCIFSCLRNSATIEMSYGAGTAPQGHRGVAAGMDRKPLSQSTSTQRWNQNPCFAFRPSFASRACRAQRSTSSWRNASSRPRTKSHAGRSLGVPRKSMRGLTRAHLQKHPMYLRGNDLKSCVASERHDAMRHRSVLRPGSRVRRRERACRCAHPETLDAARVLRVSIR